MPAASRAARRGKQFARGRCGAEREREQVRDRRRSAQQAQHELPRGVVGPLQVIEHECERPFAAQVFTSDRSASPARVKRREVTVQRVDGERERLVALHRAPFQHEQVQALRGGGDLRQQR